MQEIGKECAYKKIGLVLTKYWLLLKVTDRVLPRLIVFCHFLYRKCDDPSCYISINEIISHQKRMDGSDGVGKSRRGSLQPGSDDEDHIGHSGSAGIADMKSRLNTRRGSFVPPKSPSMTRCSCGSR